ncbi:MAG: hypothetical protein H6839_14425 [Planctomycetes bacterium]|nr:hypothetical protein [Planctomycetota bacterium]
MKPLMFALCLLLTGACVLLTACEDEFGNGANRGRIVEQDRLDNPLVDITPVDSAVQTEAVTAMGTIAQQVKLKASFASDRAAFYRSISGKLDAAKCSKLGITEDTLKGTYYQASDYSLVISGRKLTIHAAEVGSRGRVEPRSYDVP